MTTRTSPYSIHADGYWDYMPPGHRIDVLMDDDGTRILRSGEGSAPRAVGARPAIRPSVRPALRPTTVVMTEPDGPTTNLISAPPRRIKRTHASAWILLLAIGATGGALAVAHMHDPQTLGERLDSALAEMKSLTGSSSTTTTATTTSTAQTDVAAATTPAASEAAAQDVPTTTALATIPDPTLSSDAPLPTVAPAAGRSVIHPAPDVAVAKQPAVAVKPQPEPRQLQAMAPSATRELMESTPQVVPAPVVVPQPVQPMQMTPVQPIQPIQQVQPIQAPPVVQPPVTQPPVDVVPPPVTPPASSPAE